MKESCAISLCNELYWLTRHVFLVEIHINLVSCILDFIFEVQTIFATEQAREAEN